MHHLASCYAFLVDSEGMGKPSSRPPDLVVAALVVMALVVVLSAMPPFASMGLAVCAAVSWCIWLDRHPAP
jgi:hypothetical protein